MPQYGFEHVHHETTDMDAAVAFYKRVFAAEAEPPFQRGGANWVFVHIGDAKVTLSDRPCQPMELARYQGYDHLALTTDDFDATMAHLEQEKVSIWAGPVTLDNGQRLVFISGPDNIKIEIVERA